MDIKVQLEALKRKKEDVEAQLLALNQEYNRLLYNIQVGDIYYASDDYYLIILNTENSIALADVIYIDDETINYNYWDKSNIIGMTKLNTLPPKILQIWESRGVKLIDKK